MIPVLAAIVVIVAVSAAAVLLWLRAQLGAARAAAADAVERRFNVLEAVGDGIYIVDEDLRVTHVNEEAERLLRRTADSIVGRPLDAIVDPLGSELVPDIRFARRTGKSVDRTHEFPTTQSWVEVRVKPAATETLIYLRDVTERTRAELRLRENEQRLRLVTQNVDAVLWTTDRDARFTAIAGGALDDLSLRAETLLDQPSGVLIAEHTLDDVFAGNPVRAETGRGDRWLRHHVEPLRAVDGSVLGAVGVSLDITELKRAQQQLFDSAHRDKLTGLPNRLSLEQRLNETIEEAARDGQRLALLFVDLDRFKTINDTLGHSIGDEVLREVATRLQDTLRIGDVIARPGGDEFIILLPRIAQPAEVEAIADRVVQDLAQPVSARGRELFVNASVGAALFPEHGRDAEVLVSHADTAMYHAKSLGGNRFAVFEDAMEAAATERLVLENDLRHALVRDELRLLFQPIVNVQTRRIVGCEALVRWHHRTRGVVGPSSFIPIAEETGLIVAIDRWVLRTACQAIARLRRTEPGMRLAINLSPRDLREPDLPQAVLDALTESNLPANVLTIEVTEQVALDDSVLPTLRHLCALGVHVAVDDFGIGYSSLSYLKRLPVTALKIDRSFIQDIAEDAYDQAIVRSIITVAKALGMHVTAEGIETAAQIAFLDTLACDDAQGFLYGSPLAIEALEALVAPPTHLRLLERPA